MDVRAAGLAPVGEISERWQRWTQKDADWLAERYILENNVASQDFHEVMGTVRVILVNAYGQGGYQSAEHDRLINAALLRLFGREGDQVLVPNYGFSEIANQFQGQPDVLDDKEVRVWEEARGEIEDGEMPDLRPDLIIDAHRRRIVANVGAKILWMHEVQQRSSEATGDEKVRCERQLAELIEVCPRTLGSCYLGASIELDPRDDLVTAWLKRKRDLDDQVGVLGEFAERRQQALCASLGALVPTIGRDVLAWVMVPPDVNTDTFRGLLTDHEIPYLSLFPKVPATTQPNQGWRQLAQDYEMMRDIDGVNKFDQMLRCDYPKVLDEIERAFRVNFAVARREETGAADHVTP